MKKIVISVLTVLGLSIILCGCGSKGVSQEEYDALKAQLEEAQSQNDNEENNIEESPKPEEDKIPDSVSVEELNSLLDDINSDEKALVESLKNNYDEIYDTVGGTYDGYLNNYQAIKDWYGLVISETNKYLETSSVDYEEYFELALNQLGNDSGLLDDVVDNAYNEIYDGAYNDLYEKIYDGLLANAYDDYYNGIIHDAYGQSDYSEWFDVSSTCYQDWSNARSDFFKLWSNGRSKFFSLRIGVGSAVYSGERDFDKIKKEAYKNIESININSESSDSTNDSPEESTVENADDATVDDISEETADDADIRKEVKEAIDSYEEFVDQYCEFMKTYDESDLKMLAEYADFVKKDLEAQKKFGKIKDMNLTDAESKYYTEVSLRCSQKMLETASKMK